MRKLIVLLVFAGALVSAKAQILPLDKQRLAALKEAYLHNNEQAVKMVGSYEVMAVKLIKDKAPTVKSKILPPNKQPKNVLSLQRQPMKVLREPRRRHLLRPRAVTIDDRRRSSITTQKVALSGS